VLPLNVAKYLVATGSEMSPIDGERHGFVNQVCEPGTALDVALEVAAAICENSPFAVQHSLQAIDRIVAVDDAEAWAISAEYRNLVMASEDSKEGVAAFFEKRTPTWTGR